MKRYAVKKGEKFMSIIELNYEKAYNNNGFLEEFNLLNAFVKDVTKNQVRLYIKESSIGVEGDFNKFKVNIEYPTITIYEKQEVCFIEAVV